VSPYVSVPTRLRSSSGHGVDWRTGGDFQHAGSFIHSDKILSCPWGRETTGDPQYQFCESSVFLPTGLNAFCPFVGRWIRVVT
jgi:hypothetical protein